MRWRKQKTLEQLEKELSDKGSDWEASNTYIAIRAAKEWGILPSRLGICDPEDDLSLMVAFIDAENTVSTKDSIEQSKEAERNARSTAGMKSWNK